MAVDASTSVGSSPVTGAIRKAAQATGTSFDYLLATAKVESDLDPNLSMRSSSATGLFQFIDQTWLETLKQAGPAFGYGHYADAISRTASGRYVVDDPQQRAEIMRLRKDPTANALMGGVFTQQNAAVMSARLGRPPSEGELYIGHFLGAYSGAKAIALAQGNPTVDASTLFPAAARANRPIFYDEQGRARSIAEVCAELTRRYQAARAEIDAPASGAAPIAAVAPRPAAPVSLAPPIPAMAFADASGAATSTTSPSPAAPPPPGDTAGGMFHSLFKVGERREAMAPAVTELWGTRAAGAPAGSTTFDLFRDQPPKLRAGFGG